MRLSETLFSSDAREEREKNEGGKNMSYDINLKHLEYFIKVARLGSINKAAQMLYVSQSHLGKIIHDLEETVGAPLLNRSRQGVTLTPEGNEFLERSVLEMICSL